MSLTAGKQLLLTSAAGSGAYQISRSLRFNSGDSAYLNRTFGSSGNRKTWTWSSWIKRSRFGNFEHIFNGSGGGSPSYTQFYWSTDETLVFDGGNGVGGAAGSFKTTQVFRDPSAWYHILLSYDSTQSTSTDRIKIWVNGQQITTFSSSSYPSQNADGGINQAGTHLIGKENVSYSGFYVADVFFLDGTATTPSTFAETDAVTGQWVPKTPTGISYGTNGFKLNFSDNSTTAALGTDTSGNGNTWTVNNLSVTAGSGNDSLVDTPTSYGTDTGVGGEVRGNYCTWNPLHYRSETLSNGNLDYSAPVIAGVVRGTIPMPSTGKWYWEVTPGNTRVMLGIERTNSPVNGGYPGSTADSYAYAGADGQLWYNSSSSTYGNTFGSGDVIGVAFDADNGKLFFSKNNTWQASGNPLTGSNPAVSGLIGSWIPSIGRYDGSPTASSNFGQRAFSYTAPSGFKALCDTNLPTPVVAKGSTAMDVKLYTGNGGTQTISGLGFGPDFVWLKRRDAARNHALYDIVRGVKKYLASDSTSAEYEPASGGVSSFDASSFTVVEQGGVAVNESSASMVAWTWDAGSSTVTNTAGSITSQVRANASAGFSVVTYTGNGTGGATFGHGLGVKPGFSICKKRTGSPDGWYILHSSLGATKYIMLNSTNGSATYSGLWNNTEPTSTLFTVGVDYAANQNGVDYISYQFAPVSGYSSMGSFLGNGSSNGVFVYTGMRPRFLLTKRTDSAESWIIHDTARNQYNVADLRLRPNSSDAEATVTTVDILSNGFKLRTGNSGEGNDNGATYIYAAFAESPFQYARAR